MEADALVTALVDPQVVELLMGVAFLVDFTMTMCHCLDPVAYLFSVDGFIDLTSLLPGE